MLARIAVLAVVCSGAVLTAAPAAPAYIWWTHDATRLGVGRAALDGSGAQDTFIPSVAGTWAYARGVASDGTHVYWTNHMPNTSPSVPFAPPIIARANVDGSDVNQAFTASIGQSTSGMAVSPTHIYWSLNNQDNSGVGRTPIIGGQQYQAFESQVGQPNPRTCGVAVHGDFVYVANTSTYSIGRAKLDGYATAGQEIDGEFIKLPVGSAPCGVATDGTHLYWGIREVAGSTSGGTSIGRANLDGSGQVNTFWTGNPRITGVAVDGDFVYWTSAGNGTPGAGSIGRGSISTGGSITTFIGGLTAPFGIAADGAGPKPPPPTPPAPPSGVPQDLLAVGVSGPAGGGGGSGGSGTTSAAVPCFIPDACQGPRPDFSRVWMTRTTFAPATWNTPIAAGVTKASTAAARGTTLNYVVDRPSTVRIVIQRRAGKRWKTIVTLTRVARRARNAVPFSGRFRNRPLRPGRYRALFRATSAAQTSAPESVAFTVVR